MHLLDYLRKTGPMTAYYDTDSVIYVWVTSKPDPLGTVFVPVLGELKDEHSTKSITKFVSKTDKCRVHIVKQVNV